jgi:hypothetical protein
VDTVTGDLATLADQFTADADTLAGIVTSIIDNGTPSPYSVGGINQTVVSVLRPSPYPPLVLLPESEAISVSIILAVITCLEALGDPLDLVPTLTAATANQAPLGPALPDPFPPA